MSGKKIKAVIDTNVWISAFIYSGNEKRIVEKAIEGEFQSVIIIHIIEEFKRVMLDKFDFPGKDIFDAINEIIQISEIIEFEDLPNVKLKDKADVKIVNAAVASECDYLITGDKEIKGLRKIGKTRFVSPSEFLNELK
jgi:putative PIN family toxin of toxin-antitoxin system